MPAYNFVCANEHVTESFMTFSEWDDFSKRSVDTEGRVVQICHHPLGEHECGINAIRQFTSSPVVYNAPGFYGAIPTQVAHNSGHM